MDKIELIDRAAVIADLKKQFAAVYKDTMLRPIMDDDPFIEVLAKSEGRHMQLFLDGLEEYLMTRPTIDAAPVRRGEWVQKEIPTGYFTLAGNMPWVCSACEATKSWDLTAPADNFCPNCGADMRI